MPTKPWGVHAAPQQEGTELAPQPEWAARLLAQLLTPNPRTSPGTSRSPGELSLPRASLTIILPAPQRAEELKGPEENVHHSPGIGSELGPPSGAVVCFLSNSSVAGVGDF